MADLLTEQEPQDIEGHLIEEESVLNEPTL
jgi:hypothetical protein